MNFQGLIIGPPRAGKTSLASKLVSSHLAKGVRVFAHDPNHQYRQCVRYDSAAAWRAKAVAAASSSSKLPLGASLGGPAREMTALVLELGRKYNTADRARVPMLAVYDEGSLLGSSGSTWIDSEDQALISTRRHLGVGLLYLVQRPTTLHTSFVELATDVWVFRQPMRHVRWLAERANVSELRLMASTTLPPFRCLHLQPGAM